MKATRKSKLPPVSKTPAAPAIEVDDSEAEEPQPPRSSAKGKKRKLQDATSANSSANQVLRGTSVDVNVDQDGEAINKPPASRPRKKRKVEVEITKIESESELEQPIQSTLQGSQEEEPMKQWNQWQPEVWQRWHCLSKAVRAATGRAWSGCLQVSCSYLQMLCIFFCLC